MANRRFTSDRLYNFHKYFTVLSARFKIDSTTGAGATPLTPPLAGGFGQPSTSVSTWGGGIQQVYGYAASPSTGNVCAQGVLAVQLQDNYKSLIGMSYSLAGPVTGSAINIADSSVLTVGLPYQVVTLGTSTTANWQSVGVPAGITAQVGTVFLASVTGGGTGTGTVKALASSNLTSIETAGFPDYTLSPSGQPNGFNGGSAGWLYFNCWKTATQTQPTNGTYVWLNLFLAN